MQSERSQLSERQAAVASWLGSRGIRAELDPAALTEVQTLFAPHKGFGVLWSLIMYDRASYQEELKNVNLGTPVGVARASELQGQIRAIDVIYETLLDIADPTVQGMKEEIR